MAVVSSSFAQCDLAALLNTKQLAEGFLMPYREEQLKDPSLASLILYLEDGRLPDSDEEARKILLQRSEFVMSGNVLHLVDSKRKYRPMGDISL